MEQQGDAGSGNSGGARSTQGSRRTAMRLMQRKSQGLVAVYEQDPETSGDAVPHLVFESRAQCTQVSQFPKEWHRLSDDELVAIQRHSA